jgi:hypothetical protein
MLKDAVGLFKQRLHVLDELFLVELVLGRLPRSVNVLHKGQQMVFRSVVDGNIRL